MTNLQWCPFSIDRALRATFLLGFAWTLIGGCLLSGAAAQSFSQTTNFHWDGTLAQGKILEIRGIYGSIRAIPSTNGSIQVDARIHNPALSRVDVVPSGSGITICSVASTPNGNENECQPEHRTASAESNSQVDFVIHVPAGVRFSASMIYGDITVNSLQSDVNVATIDGNIELNESRDQGAEFYGNTVNGAINSDFPIYDSAPSLPKGSPVDSHRPRIVRARIGDGGPALDASSVSGTIRLRAMVEQ